MQKHFTNELIRNAIKNKMLSHAYLFYGDKGVDVNLIAFNSIKEILSSHNININANSIEEMKYYDLKWIKANENNLITKEVVDMNINQLFETSLEKNNLKILYIENIENGNKSSLNRLLKFIEEPVNNLIIIMTSNHFDKVISTIKSRSQNIYIKRENVDSRIEEIKKVEKRNFVILANMYSNINQVKKIDLDSFNKTYDHIIECFKQAIENKFLIKEKIHKLWTKNNNEFVISILQFFFYQLMTEINKKNPFFPNEDNLIQKYKEKKLNCFLIIKEIEKVKKEISHFANFNMQKTNFLNFLEKEIR